MKCYIMFCVAIMTNNDVIYVNLQQLQHVSNIIMLLLS